MFSCWLFLLTYFRMNRNPYDISRIVSLHISSTQPNLMQPEMLECHMLKYFCWWSFGLCQNFWNRAKAISRFADFSVLNSFILFSDQGYKSSNIDCLLVSQFFLICWLIIISRFVMDRKIFYSRSRDKKGLIDDRNCRCSFLFNRLWTNSSTHHISSGEDEHFNFLRKLLWSFEDITLISQLLNWKRFREVMITL